MTEMMKQLQKLGIVPVVVLDRAEDALPLAERLVSGGLPCAEVTFLAHSFFLRYGLSDSINGIHQCLSHSAIDKRLCSSLRIVLSMIVNFKVCSLKSLNPGISNVNIS